MHIVLQTGIIVIFISLCLSNIIFVSRPSEQQTLKDLVKSKAAHHKRTHAQILLALDENGPAMCEADVARVCAITIKTVQRIRKRAVEEGLDIAIESKFNQRQRPAPKLDGEQHAHLVTLASSTPPEGRIRWTMELLADKLVELKIVDSISDTTVWRKLKKTYCSRLGLADQTTG